MTNLGSTGTEEPADKAAPVKKGLGLSPVQVIAGGAAAALASVIGGHLGLAGTVVGAFILSVVSGIALPLFRTSLEKSHEQIRRVAPRRATDAARRTSPPLAVDTSGIVRATSSNVSAVPWPLEHDGRHGADAHQTSRKAATGAKVWMTIGGTATIFAIGVGSILGLQAVTGVSLSHGTSALQSDISQVVTTVKDGKVTSPTDTKPGTPAVTPSTAPTDPATGPTEAPTEQPAVTPAPTSDPTPSAEPTAPAGAVTPAPPESPDPAAGLSDGSSGAGAAGSPVQPGPGTSAGDAPAK